MEKSIFSRIIDGEIPSFKVYEDDYTVAFLDIHPTQPGHTLVVPKKQVDHFEDLEEEDYRQLWETVKIVSQKLHVFGKKRIGLQIIGVDVPHAHVHLIPFDTTEEFRTIPDMTKEPDFAKLEKTLNIILEGEKTDE